MRNYEKGDVWAAGPVFSRAIERLQPIDAIHYQRTGRESGAAEALVNAHIVLSDLSSQIGREEPGKITLSGKANINVSSLFGPQQAEMQLKMKAQPIFNAQEGAIYLHDIEIVDAQVQPEKMASIMKTLTPYLNESLKRYFNEKPAYVLSEDRSKGEALAKKFAKGIEVKPGQLVIPFTD